MERKAVRVGEAASEALRPIRRIASGYGEYVASELKAAGEPIPFGIFLRGLSDGKKRRLGEILETLIKALGQ